jgi:hypothetical protein
LSSTNPNCSATTYPEAEVTAATNRFSSIEFSITWSFATLYIFTTLSLIVAPSLYAFIAFFENSLMLLTILFEYKKPKFRILKEL